MATDDEVCAFNKVRAERDAATARAERAEAANQRVRAHHSPKACERDHWMSEGTPWHDHEHCSACGPKYPWPCPTIAALDSTQPDTPAPERAGRFETLLGTEHEQFDQRGELLRSVVEYMDAPSGTVSAPAPGRSGEEKICDWCANGDCANCDWDQHIPPNRCTHNCLSGPVGGEERK